MRNRFDEQLAMLNVELIKMGSLCELVISNSMKGLIDDNDEMLKLVFETDSEIDEKEREIETMCFKLMLQQQPVARDMRTISSALKMITDMERIGDQASDIAEIAQYIENDQSKNHTHIAAMAESAAAMVTDAIKSFVSKDLDLAYKVMAEDDIVDNHFDEVRNDLIELIRGKETSPERCLDLLMIAKYFERIGDHAVNIAEWVEFSITGEHTSAELRDNKFSNQ
jgi:phosphate transport system regulatory protein PhoU